MKNKLLPTTTYKFIFLMTAENKHAKHNTALPPLKIDFNIRLSLADGFGENC